MIHNELNFGLSFSIQTCCDVVSKNINAQPKCDGLRVGLDCASDKRSSASPERGDEPARCDPTFAATPGGYNTLLSQIASFFDWLLSDGVHLPNNARRAIGFVKSHALQYAASSPRAGFAYLLLPTGG